MTEEEAPVLSCISPSERAGSKLVPKAAHKGCEYTEKISEWNVKVTGGTYPASLVINREKSGVTEVAGRTLTFFPPSPYHFLAIPKASVTAQRKLQ